MRWVGTSVTGELTLKDLGAGGPTLFMSLK